MKKFPTYDFLITGDNGIGDTFMDAVTILTCHQKHFSDQECNINFIYPHYTRRSILPKFDVDDFHQVLDFFCLEKPNFKINSKTIYTKNMSSEYIDEIRENNLGIPEYKKIRGQSFLLGFKWKFNFEINKNRNGFSYIFYNNKYFDQLPNKSISDYEESAFIRFINEKSKETDIEPLYQNIYDVRNRINPIKHNFRETIRRNLMILNNSEYFIGSEGLWTHLSRALDVKTIMLTEAKEFIREADLQGHIAHKRFDHLIHDVYKIKF